MRILRAALVLGAAAACGSFGADNGTPESVDGGGTTDGGAGTSDGATTSADGSSTKDADVSAIPGLVQAQPFTLTQTMTTVIQLSHPIAANHFVAVAFAVHGDFASQPAPAAVLAGATVLTLLASQPDGALGLFFYGGTTTTQAAVLTLDWNRRAPQSAEQAGLITEWSSAFLVVGTASHGVSGDVVASPPAAIGSSDDVVVVTFAGTERFEPALPSAGFSEIAPPVVQGTTQLLSAARRLPAQNSQQPHWSPTTTVAWSACSFSFTVK